MSDISFREKEVGMLEEGKEFSLWAERVLLVDDDVGLLMLMQRHMESFGLESDKAMNGKEAIACLKEREYGVVITDMMMPEIDGMELLHYISEHHLRCDVIVVSGHSKVYSFTDVITAGATDFIAKPFERDELKAKLKRIFRERRLIADLHNEIRAHELESLKRREEQDKLRTITSTANDAIVMMDNDGLITFWNEAAERIFGYSSSEAHGQNVHGLIVPRRYDDIFQQGFQRFQQAGTGRAVGATLELVGRRKNGEEFPVELSLAAVSLNDTWHAVGLMKDITQRKRTEAELLKAKAEAEVASKTKSDFMNTISHELRTPMNGIMGFAALLSNSEMSEKQRNYLSLLQKSSDRLMALIVQLLNFSSVEASTKDLNAAVFNFQDFVDTILTQFQPKAEAKGLSLVFRIDDDVPAKLHGDHVILQQIVSNIVDNAVKYTDEGGIVCEATIKENPAKGPIMLQVSIKDSGCSIPPEKQEMIFEPFTQAEEYKTRKYQGAGIGLTVAAKLVDLMGGTIWLESRKGKGTTFYFTVQLDVAGD